MKRKSFCSRKHYHLHYFIIYLFILNIFGILTYWKIEKKKDLQTNSSFHLKHFAMHVDFVLMMMMVISFDRSQFIGYWIVNEVVKVLYTMCRTWNTYRHLKLGKKNNVVSGFFLLRWYREYKPHHIEASNYFLRISALMCHQSQQNKEVV